MGESCGKEDEVRGETNKGIRRLGIVWKEEWRLRLRTKKKTNNKAGVVG